MRVKWFAWGLLSAFIICAFCNVLLQNNAQAYWTDQNGTQCFSVKYEDGTVRNDPVTGNLGGTQVHIVSETAYSTYQICASVDSNGKVTGKLTRKIRPQYTQVTGMPDLYLNGDKNTVLLYACKDKSKSSCGRDELQDTPQEFKVSSYTTFRQLAEAVTNAAQANYQNDSNIPKAGIDDNDTQQELHEQAAEQHKEELEEAVENAPANKCKASGGALSLGWVVCPIMEWLSETATNIYNDYIEPSLRIEPQLFTNGNSSTQDAWSTFRDFANIAFVILLLFVIFSQLTGVGIDNYGIKKALPKLIVAAVLINLSYAICELAVDISNILGNSFQSLFTELGNNLYLKPLDLEGETVDLMSEASVATGLSAVGLLGLLGGGTFAILANPAVLLSILVSAIGIAVALFFLFVLLSMRQAAIVVLVVIAPLAFVAYILPNTKRLFDKWLDFFKGLLIVYPVCGLLVGGGNYVSRLILAAQTGNGNFLTAFTAMLVGVLPIFFIPMVVKNAFNGMGSVGAKLAGLGGKIGGRATGALRGTDAYKNAQELGMERRTRLRAGVDADGKAMKVGRLGTLMRGGERNMARARAQYLRNQDARDRERNLMGIGYEAATIGQTKRAEAEELGNYMTLINDKTRNGEDETALSEIFDQYMAAGNKAGAVAAARIAGRRKDTAANFAQSKLTNAGVNGPGMDAGSRYDPKMLQSVAKEMATGENSGNYRAASPLAFEFASQINKAGIGEDGKIQADTNYAHWSSQGGNVSGALEHHVTNSSELVGMKNSSLNEIADMMRDGRLDPDTKARMQKLAAETIADRGQTGVWDTTKETSINRIAAGG